MTAIMKETNKRIRTIMNFNINIILVGSKFGIINKSEDKNVNKINK